MSNSERVPSNQLMYWIDDVDLVLANPPPEAFDDVCYFFANIEQDPWLGIEDSYGEEKSSHNLYIHETIDGSWTCEFVMWTEPTNPSEYMLRFSVKEGPDLTLIPTVDDLLVP